MVSNETNIADNIDMQEMLHLIEETFQEKFKTNWDRKFEEEKLIKKLATKYPTRSFSDICSDKLMLMYVKSQEELVMCNTYCEMCRETHNKMMKQLMTAKATEHLQRSKEWMLMITRDRKELQTEIQYNEKVINLLETVKNAKPDYTHD